MMNQYLTLLRRSVGLTTLAATLSWVFSLTHLGRNFLVGSPLTTARWVSIQGEQKCKSQGLTCYIIFVNYWKSLCIFIIYFLINVFFFNLKMMALINFANKILSDMAGAAFFHYSGIDVEHILVLLLIWFYLCGSSQYI